MILYRLSSEPYARDLSGKGAAMKGARWNSVGVEMIYTASSRALAMSEVAVHFSLATMPSDYMMVELYLPDNTTVFRIPDDDLPIGWDLYPHASLTQAIGDAFIYENKFCLFSVPSAVVKGDYNFLINPRHAEAAGLQILSVVRFPFDERLFR